MTIHRQVSPTRPLDGSRDLGLGQSLYAGPRSMTAFEALLVDWPPLVILASCWVALQPLSRDAHPMGFPVSCLLGGAEHVVGGIFDVPARSTTALIVSTDFSRAIQRPALMLAESQRRMIDLERNYVDWAGLICFSAS